MLGRATLGLLAVLLAPVAPGEGLRVAGDRLFLPVAINGTPAEGLLDSGAELTLVDTAFAARIGLPLAGAETARGTGGTAPVRFAHDVDIAAAGLQLAGRTVAVIDLADVSRRLLAEPLQVVIGRELFDQGRWRLDIGNGIFELLADDVSPAGTRLDLREHAGIMQLRVEIDGEPAWADFDLGNGSEMLVAADYAARRGWLVPERIVGRKDGGGIGGARPRDLLRLGSVSLAGRRFDGVVAAVDSTDGAAEANVGVALLRHFVMTIDFRGKAVWMDPGSAAPGVARPPAGARTAVPELLDSDTDNPLAEDPSAERE